MNPEDLILKNLNADFLFSKPQDEKVDFIHQDLVELKPYGLSLANDTTRPFLLLKDEKGLYTLPVSISQIEAGMTLTHSSVSQPEMSPHKFVEKLIESLDIKIEKCVFIEIKGLHQYVRVYMSGHPKYQSIKLKAEEAMSLCLHLKVPLYASIDFIQKSKLMTAEISYAAKNLLHQPEFLNFKKNCH